MNQTKLIKFYFFDYKIIKLAIKIRGHLRKYGKKRQRYSEENGTKWASNSHGGPFWES